ncbi:MAG: YicC family protein [Bacteroidales bacterium]|jgi:uncharacterized protein (TIGR00255 family)|nr:YicC family protein [Bacteroidales bacterium]
MIKSMTGYGKATAVFSDKKFIVEIRTLNSKQADIILKIPKDYLANEIDIRNKISSVLERGKIDCLLTVEVSPDKQPISINQELFNCYYTQTLWLQNDFSLDKNEHIKYLLTNPDIAKVAIKDPCKEEVDTIFEALNQALQFVDEFRINEGKILTDDLKKRVGIIETLLLEIEPYEKERVPQIKERIYANLLELEFNKTDENRLEQELIYYLEKLDFTEEKVRLKKHIDYFYQTIMSPHSEGKKLGFIVQEMLREINTLGSKANDAAIQQIVVKMKDEIEKIKEQLCNIL